MDWTAAISSKHIVSFNYDAHPRVVIPVAYGIHVSTGTLVVPGYQMGGSSNTRAVPLWDIFLIEKSAGARISSETFTDDPPLYRRNDRHMSVIYSQL
jgi:hypothetical protein